MKNSDLVRRSGIQIFENTHGTIFLDGTIIMSDNFYSVEVEDFKALDLENAYYNYLNSLFPCGPFAEYETSKEAIEASKDLYDRLRSL